MLYPLAAMADTTYLNRAGYEIRPILETIAVKPNASKSKRNALGNFGQK